MNAPAASPRPHLAARREIVCAAALAAAVLLTYGAGLRNQLVWDDVLSIADNPRVHSLGAAAADLGRPQGIYYRPLVFLSYAVEYAAWDAAPLGYHLTNLLLHVANTLLLLGLARRSGVEATAALIGAAVFALHPVQTEAVAYVSGRTDLLMTGGALLSCLVLLAGWPAPVRGLGAAAAGALAMLSKESGFALVLVWPWLARCRGGGWRERLALVGPGLILAWLVLMLRPGALPLSSVSVRLSRLAGAGQAVLAYAGVLAWPGRLQIDRLTVLPSDVAGQALGVLALAAVLGLAAFGLTRRGAAAEWTAWTVAFYLPVANLIALYPSIAERALFTPEHNLYAPLAGLGVLAGIGVQRLRAGRSPARRRAVLVAAMLVLIGWAGLSAARCTVWHDEEQLFGTAVAAGSASPRVWYNYGNALLQRGAVAAAADVFAGAAQRAPTDAAIWTNLAVARQRLRDYDGAELAYRRAATLAPREARIFENLGTLYLARGDLAAARAAFTTALEIDPALPTARRALAALAPMAPTR